MGFPNLKAEMARKGISATEVAAVVGLHQNNFYPILNGRRSLSVRRALKIKRELFPDQPMEYLFDEDPVDDRTA